MAKKFWSLKREGFNKSLLRFFLIIELSLFSLSIFFSCRQKIQEPEIKLPPIPQQKMLPVDYVFIIDNSGSIRTEQRDFVREVLKLFIELAEVNDKISIISFDIDSRLLCSKTISTPEDRLFLTENVPSGLSFNGNYTDISKPFNYIRGKESELFRGSGYSPVIIIMSDGKLEPPSSHPVESAYNEIMNSLQRELTTYPFFTIGLGDSEIYDFFLPNQQINGLKLMKSIAEFTSGRFYHIHSKNQFIDPFLLIDTYVDIIRTTKKLSIVPGRTTFRVDKSVEKIVSIIMKVSVTEKLCSTPEISIIAPDKRKITYFQKPDFVLWRSLYYFDVITIENPEEGEWKIELDSGAQPNVINIFKSYINLRFDIKKEYWSNEEKIVRAWLYDEKNGRISSIPCELRARFQHEEKFESSSFDIPFEKKNDGTYITLLKSKDALTIEPGDYLIQIRAENKDKWFYRMEGPFRIRIKEPFFSFIFPDNMNVKKVGWKGVVFKGEIDTKHKNFLSFEEGPELIVSIEKIEKDGKLHLLPSVTLERVEKNGKFSYTKVSLLDKGSYQGYFVLKGLLTNGERMEIRSEKFYFSVVGWWFYKVIYIGVVLAVLMFSLWIIFWKTERFNPKLDGKIDIISPRDYRPSTIDLRREKNKKKRNWGRGGEYLEFGYGKKLLSDLRNVSFRLESFWKKGKKVKITVEKGTIRKNGQLFESDYIFHLDKISFSDGGREFEIQFKNPQILKTKNKTKERRVKR